LTSIVDKHTEPASMDEDEAANGIGANPEGGMPCGSASVPVAQGLVENLGSRDSNPDNLTSAVDKRADPAPMDEDEGANGIGVNPQGGMPCGSASVPAAQDLVENFGSLDSDTTMMDEAEDVDKAGAEGSDEDQCADADQSSDEGADEDSDEDSDEDQPASSAAGDESRSMVVDGSGSIVDKFERRRQSSRLRERGSQLSGTKPKSSGTKPKSQREPKAPPRSQNQHKRKSELEEPLGNLNNFGTQSKPIDVDFLQQGSLWDPDGLDTYVSYNRI
jgi:hypothetical protein